MTGEAAQGTRSRGAEDGGYEPTPVRGRNSSRPDEGGGRPSCPRRTDGGVRRASGACRTSSRPTRSARSRRSFTPASSIPRNTSKGNVSARSWRMAVGQPHEARSVDLFCRSPVHLEGAAQRTEAPSTKASVACAAVMTRATCWALPCRSPRSRRPRAVGSSPPRASFMRRRGLERRGIGRAGRDQAHRGSFADRGDSRTHLRRTRPAYMDSVHVRALRSKARSYESAVLGWATVPPNAARVAAMLDLVSELQAKKGDGGPAARDAALGTVTTRPSSSRR